jgi:hypothetical protein
MEFEVREFSPYDVLHAKIKEIDSVAEAATGSPVVKAHINTSRVMKSSKEMLVFALITSKNIQKGMTTAIGFMNKLKLDQLLDDHIRLMIMNTRKSLTYFKQRVV